MNKSSRRLTSRVIILSLTSAALLLLVTTSCSLVGLHHTSAAASGKLSYDAWQVSSQPKLLMEKKPHYPRKAQRDGVEALVSLRLTIDENGDVDNIIVIDTKAPRFKKEFEHAAIKAVKHWKFAPAILGKDPVPCYAKVVVKFRIK